MEIKVFENNVFNLKDGRVVIIPMGEENVGIRTIEGNTTSDDDGAVILTREAALEVAKHIIDGNEENE